MIPLIPDAARTESKALFGNIRDDGGTSKVRVW